jgi:hypothetical protein
MTYFVVQSFQGGRKGVPFADPPVVVAEQGQAERLAARLAESKLAVVALSVEDEGRGGTFGGAIIVAQYGELPEYADEMAIAI